MKRCKHEILINNQDGTLRCTVCKEVITAFDLNEICKNKTKELSTGESCLHRNGGKLVFNTEGTTMLYKCNECGLEFNLLSRVQLSSKLAMRLDTNDIIQNIKIYNKNITKDDIYKLYKMDSKSLIMELQVALSVYESEIISKVGEDDKNKILESLLI